MARKNSGTAQKKTAPDDLDLFQIRVHDPEAAADIRAYAARHKIKYGPLFVRAFKALIASEQPK